MLTSSNYDDNVKQTVGGQNGLGAKLVNIYSKEFVVEIDDAIAGQSYKQVWRNNMNDKEKVKITKYSGAQNSTAITFYPDFARFGMGDTNCFNQDMIDLFTKRVYDIAGTTHKSLKVTLNKVPVAIPSFKDYMHLYLGTTRPSVLEQIHPRWQVGVSINDTGVFAQVSFVNSIATARGGKHVDYMEELVAEALLEQVKKKSKTLKDTKPAEIKKHLFMFVNSLIFNPSFDSQTKTYCTSSKADLQLTVDPVTKKESKEKVTLPESFVKQLTKSGLVAMLTERLEERSKKSMSKTDGKKLIQRLTGIPKLEDANRAGTKDGHQCTLILTEGDSAKALAVSGLAVVGRDHYGVFPLKGKLLNVREASHKQIMENSEVTAIKQILGLKANVKYTDTRDLRYGHVMIMADQDHDGSHIKGLVINLFAHFWPSLLALPGFLQEFITPIVKVSRGVSVTGAVTSKNAKEKCFYTLPEYEQWKASLGAAAEKGWTIKYYKGLGTSTAVEAKNYFSDLPKHKLTFTYEGRLDDEAIDMAFSRAKADARKDWLGAFVPGTFLSQEAGKLIPYAEFVNKELILFSVASNQRAIPNIIDGFKPGQRKILFAAFKRNLKKEIKVAQLAGYVSENSAYHHGEASLCATIVGMAQNFVGSNNINLLLPNGQFGTRLQGGKDAASPRYIFTSLNPVTRAIFPSSDDCLLNYLTDDGQSIEPEFYVPIVPMVLINGSSGIGTGWSSNVPNYDARAIIHNLRLMIGIHDSVDGDQAAMEIPFISQLPDLHPAYKGFTGAIKHKGGSSYVVKGTIEKLPNGSIHITELPLQRWTSDYKLQLEAMLTGGEIKEFREYHTDSTVSFVVDLTPEQMTAYESNGMTLYKKFKLNASMTSSNMVLFTHDGKLKKYNTANDILIEFFHIRMHYYAERKKAMVQAARAEERKLNDKVRFIRDVHAGVIPIKEGKAKILAALVKGKYERIPKQHNKKKQEQDDGDGDASGDDVEVSGAKSLDDVRPSDFDYLLSMPIWSLTKERAEALQAESAAKASEVRSLLATTPSQMWLTDLAHFEAALDQQERSERQQESDAAARSLERRLATCKSELARKKLRAELEQPVPKGVVVPDYSDDFDEDKPVKEKKATKAKKEAILALGNDDDVAALLATDAKSIKEKKSSGVTKKLAPASTGGAKKTATAPAKKRSKKIDSEEEDDDDDDIDEMSDSDMNVSMSPIAPRAKTNRRAAAVGKKSYIESEGEEDEEDDDDNEDVEMGSDDGDADQDREDDARLDFDDGDDFLDESDYEMTPVKAKKSAPAPAPKAKGKATKTKDTEAAPSKKTTTAAEKKAASAATAAPKKGKSKKVVDSEDEEDDDVIEIDDESDFELPTKSKKTAPTSRAEPKKAAKAKAEPIEKVKEVKESKPKAEKKSKTTAASAVAPAPVPVSVPTSSIASLSSVSTSSSSSSSSSTSSMSLADRLAARFASVGLSSVTESVSSAVSASAIVSTPPKKKKPASKREKDAIEQTLLASPTSPDPKRRKLFNQAKSKEALDQAAATPITKPTKAATSKPKKNTKKSSKRGSDEEDQDEDEVEEVKPKKGQSKSSATTTSTRPQRSTKPTKSYVEKDDDEDEDEDEDQDVSVEEISDDDYSD